jgi:hypothetical protein
MNRYATTRTDRCTVYSRFFRSNFFASLRFSTFGFKAKQSEAKFKSIFSLFFIFFTFFRIFSLFLLNFRFASIFSLNFRLFYLRFRFRFLVFRIEVNNVKSGFFFAYKRNEIFTSISNFASEAKVRAHPTLSSQRRSLFPTRWSPVSPRSRRSSPGRTRWLPALQLPEVPRTGWGRWFPAPRSLRQPQ